MIGLIRNIAGEVTALHRTYLAEQPDKVTKAAIAKPRMMLGKTAGGTVPYLTGFVINEGIAAEAQD